MDGIDMNECVGGWINGWISVSHMNIHPLLAERRIFKQWSLGLVYNIGNGTIANLAVYTWKHIYTNPSASYMVSYEVIFFNLFKKLLCTPSDTYRK